MAQEKVTVESFGTIEAEDKTWGGLIWLLYPLLGIVALLIDDKKKRAYIKHHAVQSIAACIVVMIASITLIGAILGPVFWIWGMINGFSGKPMNIPVITNLCKKQGWI